MAQKVAGLGIPVFACNPELLPQLLERALKGQDLAAFQKEFEKRKHVCYCKRRNVVCNFY